MVESTPRIRRVRRPWRLVGICIVLVMGLFAAFLAGRFVESPSRDKILAAQDPIPVVAEVELRVVDSGVRFAGSVRDGESLDLFAHAVSSPAVVTRAPLSVGVQIEYGSFLGTVSGQPFFALPGPLPLYRDLAVGMRGDDVVAFQASLHEAGIAASQSGEIDWVTYAAIQNLFKSQGSRLGWGTPIPYAQFLPIPNNSGTITAAAAVGTRLDADTPLVSVKISPPGVFFRADAVSASQLAVGDAMRVQIGAGSFKATIATIGAFGQGPDGSAPGRDVMLVSPDELLLSAASGTPATVSASLSESDPAPAVPITAVRRDTGGDYVERQDVTEDGVTFERVAVTTLRSGGGWVAVASDGMLLVGDRVRVS